MSMRNGLLNYHSINMGLVFALIVLTPKYSQANYCIGPRAGCNFTANEIQAVRDGMACAAYRLRRPKAKQEAVRCTDLAEYYSNSLVQNISVFGTAIVTARPQNNVTTHNSRREFSLAREYFNRHRERLAQKAAQAKYKSRMRNLPHLEGEELLGWLEDYNKMTPQQRRELLSDPRHRQIIEAFRGSGGMKLMIRQMKEMEAVINRDPFLNADARKDTLRRVKAFVRRIQSPQFRRNFRSKSLFQIDIPWVNLVRDLVTDLGDFDYRDILYPPRQPYTPLRIVDGLEVSGRTRFEDLPPEFRKRMIQEQMGEIDTLQGQLASQQDPGFTEGNNYLIEQVDNDLRRNGGSDGLKSIAYRSAGLGEERVWFQAPETEVSSSKNPGRRERKDRRAAGADSQKTKAQSINPKAATFLTLAGGAALMLPAAAYRSYVNSNQRCRYENVWQEARGSASGNATTLSTLPGAPLKCKFKRRRSDKEVLSMPPGTIMVDLFNYSNDEIVNNLRKVQRSGYRPKSGRVTRVREVDSQAYFWDRSCRLLRQLQVRYLCDGEWIRRPSRPVPHNESFGIE